MRIDKTHRPWGMATAALLVVSTIAYILYAVRTPGGARGGTALGLTFGIIGYGMMLYAGALGARKKVPVMRLGRAQTWMRGHLWLGAFSLVLILFHGGFAFRGPLTAVLMGLFFFVVLSGFVGAAIQHYLPRVMVTRVPMETIYEEIPHVREQLRDEADQLVSTVCGSLDGSPDDEASRMTQQGGVAALVDIEQEDRAKFREVYLRKVRPFLNDPDSPAFEFSNPRRSGEVFGSLRTMLASPIHGVLADLENICEEEYQLIRQIRIYRWLHGWLLVHVPLSIVLLVLGGIHAVMALRY